MKSRTWSTSVPTILFAALVNPLLPAQKGVIVEFDAPGAARSPGSLGTQALANNDLGAIVGYYVDAKVIPHGFLRSPDGRFTCFDAPGAGLGEGLNQGTLAISINAFGEIAGQLQDPNYLFHGFVRFPGGSFETFEAPGSGSGANQGTLAYNINFKGDTAGVSIDSSNLSHGFVRTAEGHISVFDVPGAVGGTFVCMETCLSPQGTVAGWYVDSNGYHGFERTRDGAIATFDSSNAGAPPNLFTIGASINLEGAITGYSLDSSGTAHGYVRSVAGKLTTFDDPVASTAAGGGTAPFSINLFGAITGEFIDAGSAMHGFALSPDGSFLAIDAPHAGKGAGQGTRPSTNNSEGVVTGWFVDGNGVSHGFAWSAWR